LPGSYFDSLNEPIFNNHEITDRLSRDSTKNIIAMQSQISRDGEFTRGADVRATNARLLVFARTVFAEIVSFAIAFHRAKSCTPDRMNKGFAALLADAFRFHTLHTNPNSSFGAA